MTSKTSVIIKAIVIYPFLLIGLSAMHMIAPQRSGLLALTQIFAPHLFLAALALLPFTLHQGALVLRLALLICALIYGVRFVPLRSSQPRLDTSETIRFSVMSWNVLFNNHQVNDIRGALKNSSAQTVAIQELTPKHKHAIEDDRELTQRYPYRLLQSNKGSTGMGLLSTYPILEYGTLHMVPTLWARLDLGSGQTVTVVNAHPTLGDPHVTRFDSAQRDSQIAEVRALIAPMLRRDQPLILLGDFNVTERELAYQELTAGLQDAHVRSGVGNGNTWRPEELKRLRFGLLRIDYLLTSPEVVPLQTRVDCTPYGSDHCVVHGVFALDAKGS